MMMEGRFKKPAFDLCEHGILRGIPVPCELCAAAAKTQIPPACECKYGFVCARCDVTSLGVADRMQLELQLPGIASDDVSSGLTGEVVVPCDHASLDDALGCETCHARALARALARARSPHQDVLLNLPESAADRKQIPICTGVLDYFPAALAEVARLSVYGNRQHNGDEPLHWARGKSTDQADTIVRHLMQRGLRDVDGIRHSAKVAWRALAMLQEEIEREAGFDPGVS
jgi:hypothetical protein